MNNNTDIRIGERRSGEERRMSPRYTGDRRRGLDRRRENLWDTDMSQDLGEL